MKVMPVNGKIGAIIMTNIYDHWRQIQITLKQYTYREALTSLLELQKTINNEIEHLRKLIKDSDNG